MQKTGKNASILIWAIFLSIIISLGFISISTQINKTLKNNKNIQQEISQSNQVQSILKSANPSSQQLDN
jgi:putative exporter of polyketide antibiotics